MKDLINNLNEKCTKYNRELNQTVNYKKDGVTIKIIFLKIYKRGTKRVFFAPYTEDLKLIGKTYFARKGEAENQAEAYVKFKINQLKELV